MDVTNIAASHIYIYIYIYANMSSIKIADMWISVDVASELLIYICVDYPSLETAAF